MRDTTVSVDDLAIQAAKNKLADLPSRAGYAEAMAPKGNTSRTGQLVMLALSVLFLGLLLAVWSQLDRGVLFWVLTVVLNALMVFSLLAAGGLSPEKPPAAIGAAILGKQRAPDELTGDPGAPFITLLDSSGATRDIRTNDALYDLIRVGDVGVAHERTKLLVNFVRL